MFGCKPCSDSDPCDPYSDSVKVDAQAAHAAAREQRQRQAEAAAAEERRKAEVIEHIRMVKEAQEQSEKDEQERNEKEEIEKGHLQVKRAEAERQCLIIAEEHRQRWLIEERERQLIAEEDKQRMVREESERLESKRSEETERLRKQQEAKVLEEQKRRDDEVRAEEAQAKARLDSWLQQQKFTGVNDKRKTMIKAKYPLHSAVKRQDVALIQLLMRFNADPSLKDSSNLTPKLLADRNNADGSYEAILHALSSCN